MPAYLHPGVYVEEIPSGSKPIEGVATSVAAFIGKTTKGPVGKAELIQSFDDYNNIYGDISSEDDAMGFTVQSFYLNGGKSAFICRLVGEGSSSASTENSTDKVIGEGTGGTHTSAPVLIVSATSEGKWGNTVYFRIIRPDQDSLIFDLEIGHHEKGKFVRDEIFSKLSMRSIDDNYALTRANGVSSYVELSLGNAADPENAGEQYQNAVLSGGELDSTNDTYFSSKITNPVSLVLNINSLGAKQITLNPDNFTTTLAGTGHVTDADSIASEIQKAVRGLSMEEAYQTFSCVYSTDHFVFTSAEPTKNKEKSYASVEITDGEFASLLRIDSKQPSVLNGGPGVSGGTFAGSDYFSSAITSDVTLELNIDNHGTESISLKVYDLGLKGDDNKEDGEKVALAIQNAVRALNTSIASYKDFKCEYLFQSGSVANRRFRLTSGSGSPRNSGLTINSGSLAGILALNSADGATEISGRSMNQGTARVIPIDNLTIQKEGIPLTGGKENDATPNDFTDFFNSTLRKVRDVSIVVVPGQPWADDGSGNPFISATLAHCESMKNRAVIIDPPPNLELDQAATVSSLSLPSSTYSVLYYPWVKVSNPFYNAEKNPAASKTVDVAPSGFAAGMWSRIDSKRGVWKAPAGMEAGLIGAAGLKYIIEDGEQDQLNPLGVNCFRNIPGGGRVIWGARTLATKADPEWRYVPVRRTAIMIEQSIYNGIQWAVFEPNDHRLWSALRANIGNFMNGLFRVGAFQGEKASDAYFVRCGLNDTMTQGDIDAGQVIVIVGFAPLKPAEFVIVRIQQKVNQQ